MNEASKQKLSIDPGFVHHRKIESVLGDAGTQLITEQIERIPATTPGWRKEVLIDQIYSRVMVDFCGVNGIGPLQELLLRGKGHLFCSILKTEPSPDFYEAERVSIDCVVPDDFSFKVELHLSTKHTRGDTLRSGLHKGGEFGVIAQFYVKEDDTLIFHPLVIGYPMMISEQTGDLAWTLYNDYYQLYLEDFDEFRDVRDTSLPDDFSEMRNVSEASFKACLAKHLTQTAPKDWGGETSDFFTSHLHTDGERISAAFLLKGPARFSPMTLSHLGKNSDQIVRLSKEPANVLVVQHSHEIQPVVIETLKVFATQPSNLRRYCCIDGRESLRFLQVYGYLKEALGNSL